MGKVLQKKKNRSSIPKVKKSNTGRLKNGNKKIEVLGNSLIAANWDKKLTLTQNYRRLGLSSRLNAPTGGTEKKASLSQSADGTLPGNKQQQNAWDPLHVLNSTTSTTTIKPTEARVERDPETGKILRIIHDDEGPNDDEIEVGGRKRRKANPLEDPLVDISTANEADSHATTHGFNEVFEALEAQAAMEGEALKKRRPRQQSKREEEWLARLVERHGDDVGAMVRDRKLNPMQQTEGDIKRRLKKWRQKHA